MSRGRQPRISIGGAIPLLLKSRYLVVMALVILLLNWVNSAGEYILSSIVKHSADAAVQAGTMSPGDEGRYIGTFFSDYFQLVNIIGMLLQLFVVARVVNWAGVPVAMCILPVVALVSYTAPRCCRHWRWCAGSRPENSVDYSLMNTVRQMLFLPTSRKEKFKAKQVIDSFIVRVGDVLSAITVYVGTALLSLTVAQFAWINVVLVLAWLDCRSSRGSSSCRVSAQAAVGMMRLLPRQWLLLLLAAARWRPLPSLRLRTSMPRNTARVVEMKASPRGPFASIRWFCKDGRVLQPPGLRVRAEGQGWQHGDWSDRSGDPRGRISHRDAAGGSGRRQADRRRRFRRSLCAASRSNASGGRGRRLDPAPGALLSRRDSGGGRARRRATAVDRNGGPTRMGRPLPRALYRREAAAARHRLR